MYNITQQSGHFTSTCFTDDKKIEKNAPGLLAQKTPPSGVLEYSQSDMSDVSDKSDG